MLARFRLHLITLLVAGALLSLFVLFSYIVHEGLLRQFDFDTTVRLQYHIPERVDTLFSVFSDVGKFEIVIVVLTALLIFLRRIWGVITWGMCGIFHVIEIFGKTYVAQLPPPQFLLRTHDVFDFPQFHVRMEYAYPSGHSGRAAFMSIVISLIIARLSIPLWMKCLIISGVMVYAALVYLSRVVLGEHWATDVIGGALLGYACAIIGTLWMLPRMTLRKDSGVLGRSSTSSPE